MLLKKISMLIVSIAFFMLHSSLSWDEAGNWSNNQPDHRFGNVNVNERDADNAPSVEDEGYRWRDNLNFSINDGGHNKEIAQWRFNSLVALNEENQFIQNEGFNLVADGGANYIHQILSNFSWRVRETLGGAHPERRHVAMAAMTVIIEDDSNPEVVTLKAFSQILIDHNDNAVLYAKTGHGNIALEGINFRELPNINMPPPPAKNNWLNENIGVNIHNGYNCCEGRIICYALTWMDYLQNTIGVLLDKANQYKTDPDGKKLTKGNIKLVILHIHTIKDPCAACSRVLSGLSMHMNNVANPNNINAKINALDKGEAVANSRFLVEVSSSEHYTSGNWCSHAECSGLDGSIAVRPRIDINAGLINFAAGNQLAIPFGLTHAEGQNNWSFPNSFPPYVIFKRTGVNGIAISENLAGAAVPLRNAEHDGCVLNNHQIHAVPNNSDHHSQEGHNHGVCPTVN